MDDGRASTRGDAYFSGAAGRVATWAVGSLACPSECVAFEIMARGFDGRQLAGNVVVFVDGLAVAGIFIIDALPKCAA